MKGRVNLSGLRRMKGGDGAEEGKNGFYFGKKLWRENLKIIESKLNVTAVFFTITM